MNYSSVVLWVEKKIHAVHAQYRPFVFLFQNTGILVFSKGVSHRKRSKKIRPEICRRQQLKIDHWKYLIEQQNNSVRTRPLVHERNCNRNMTVKGSLDVDIVLEAEEKRPLRKEIKDEIDPLNSGFSW